MKKLSILAFFLLATFAGWAQLSGSQAYTEEPGALVKMTTTHGDITLFLYGDTPMHRDNFIKLAKEGFYDGLLFHRVINKFMIQGGDPDSRDAKDGEMLGKGNLGYTIPPEISPRHFHKRGALCAARMGDDVNPAKESSSCQFYIVQGQVFNAEQMKGMERGRKLPFTAEQYRAYTSVGGAPHLDGEYTVFGEVIMGMDVVDKIASVECDKNNRPVNEVRILRVEVLQ